MSKQVKDLITKELETRFKDLDGVAVINPRGINAVKNNLIRRRLREKGLRMTVVRNTLARRAVGDGKLKGFDKLLDGPSALIYGEGSISAIARVLLDEKKLDETVELRGIFFDGEAYVGDKGVQQVSKLPTREEAIGAVLTAILSPGQNLGGLFKSQAGRIAGLIKTIEDKAKEREGAAPAAEAAPAPEAGSAPEAAPVA